MNILRKTLIMLAMVFGALFGNDARAAEVQIVPVEMNEWLYDGYSRELYDGDTSKWSVSWGLADQDSWFSATFENAVILKRIDVYQVLLVTVTNLKNFSIEGSNDKVNWVNIATIKDYPKPLETLVAGEIRFKNDIAYKHYRLYSKANEAHDTWPKQMVITEVVFWKEAGNSGNTEEPDPPKEIEFPEGFPEALAVALKELNKSINDGFDAVEGYLKPMEATNREAYDKFEWWLKYLGLSVSALSGIILMSFVWDFVRRGPL